MVTDNERREVARRLREYVDLPDDWCADTYSGFYVEKCAFGNVERHRESELFDRLADLIEPDDHFADTGEKVDRDALLRLADEMEEFGNLPVKHPGIRVLHNDDFSRELGYARRIRKALGVSDD